MKKFALLALLLNSAYGQTAPELCNQLSLMDPVLTQKPEQHL